MSDPEPRRSGRARKPALASLNEDLISSQEAAPKAKRARKPKAAAKAAISQSINQPNDEENEEQDVDMNDVNEEFEAESSEAASESEADEEEHSARKRKPAARKPKATAARKPRAPAKPRATKKQNGDASATTSRKRVVADGEVNEKVEEIEQSFSSLWHSVARSTTTVKSIARSWIDSYRSDESATKTDLLNFFIQACGGDGGLTEEQVAGLETDDIDIDAVVETLNQVDRIVRLEAPIKRVKKFQHRLKEFFVHLFTLLPSDLLVEHSFFNSVFPLLMQGLSKSPLRIYRVTSTVIYTGWVQGLNEQCKTLETQIHPLLKQKNVKGKGKKFDPAQAMQEALDSIKGLLTSSNDAIFNHRFRDIDEAVRALCIESLGGWLVQWPEYYLVDSRLKYVGWALSDKSAPVRKEALTALIRVYSTISEEQIAQMGNFTGRFLGRIEQMCSDKDPLVCSLAIELLTALLKLDILSETQGDAVPQLLWDENPAIRKAATKFVMADTFSEAKRDQSDDLMQVLNIFDQYCPLLAATRKRASGSTDESTSEQYVETELTRYALVSASRLALLEPSSYESSVAALVEDFFPYLDCLHNWDLIKDTLAQLDESRAKVAQSSKRSKKAGAETEEAEAAERHLSCLTLILVSAARRIASNFEARSKGKSSDEVEESTAQASVDASNQMKELSTFIVKNGGNLLSMFSSSASGSAHILQLFMIVRLSDFTALRARAEFTTFLSTLKSLHSSHSNTHLLRTCSTIWRRLTAPTESCSEDASAVVDDMAKQWTATIHREMFETESDQASQSPQDESTAASDIASSPERTATLAVMYKRIMFLYRSLHLNDIAFSSPALNSINNALLDVFTESHETTAAQELLIMLLQLLYTELAVRLSELDRDRPARAQLDWICTHRDRLVDCIQVLLPSSTSYAVKDAAFQILSDCFVLFNGKLQGGVLHELMLSRERVVSLDEAFTEYFKQLMDGENLTDRVREARSRIRYGLAADKSADEEDDVDLDDDNPDRAQAFHEGLRLQCMIAASHVVCYDHHRSPIEAPRGAAANTGPLRHTLLTAMFFAQFLADDEALDPIIRSSLTTIKAMGWPVLLVVQITCLRILWERHLGQDELKKIANKFALSAGPNHPPFEPLLRMALMIAVRDSPTHLSFLDVVLPYMTRASKADIEKLVPAFVKAQANAMKDFDESRSDDFEPLERFEQALVKKIGKASLNLAKTNWEGMRSSPGTPSSAMSLNASSILGIPTPSTPTRSRVSGRYLDAIDARMSLTPITMATPRTADTARSVGSAASLHMNLSPVNEKPEAARGNKKRAREEPEEASEEVEPDDDSQQLIDDPFEEEEEAPQEEEEEEEEEVRPVKRARASKPATAKPAAARQRKR